MLDTVQYAHEETESVTGHTVVTIYRDGVPCCKFRGFAAERVAARINGALDTAYAAIVAQYDPTGALEAEFAAVE